MKSTKLLIGGGGTGGHVSPGLAVAKLWGQRFGAGSVVWVGRPDGIEERMAATAGLEFFGIPAVALRRRWDLGNLALPWRLAHGVAAARRQLRQQAPCAVLVTGGYVGVPLALATRLSKTPLVLLEPNAVLGLANRFLAPLADALCVAYPECVNGPKTVLTGTPARLDKLPSKAAALRKLKLKAGRRTLLVLPGSQAAASINQVLGEALSKLADRAHAWQIVWMTGPADYRTCAALARRAKVTTRVLPFIDDVAPAYAAADLLLCRSGASTLAELGMAGKPSLQVPYPYATADHQRANARGFERAGAAQVIQDKDLSARSLELALRAILDHPAILRRMASSAKELGKPDAAKRVIDVIMRAAKL